MCTLEKDLLRARFVRKSSFSASAYADISRYIVEKGLFPANYAIKLSLIAIT
jgi:hypothetical protein